LAEPEVDSTAYVLYAVRDELGAFSPNDPPRPPANFQACSAAIQDASSNASLADRVSLFGTPLGHPGPGVPSITARADGDGCEENPE